MIYECRNAVTEIISVDRMKWCGGNFDISPREFSALSFRISGTGTITANGKNYDINSNDILYLPQDLPYSSRFSDTEILVIHFKTSINDKFPEVYSFSGTEQIYESFLRALTLWENKSPGYEAHIISQIYSILGQLCENETAANVPEHFLKAVSYINSNYTDRDISVEKICKNAGIDTTNLRLLFKTYYKKTPTEYITALRLGYARNLISCGEPIESAAEKSGFNDSKYFARVVKKHYNCTPRELKLYSK